MSQGGFEKTTQADKEKIFKRGISIMVLVFCFIIVFGSVDFLFYRNRDIRRMSDISALSKALDIYYQDHNSYPKSENDWRGWDLSYLDGGGESVFSRILVDGGYLNKEVIDPINNEKYHYRYKKYDAGSYGCEKDFYILQISAFEIKKEEYSFASCPRIDFSKTAPEGFTIQRFE